MLQDKYKALVRSLHDKTEKGELEWQETALRNSIQVNFRASSLRLREVEVNGETDYIIDLYNAFGQAVETFSDRDLVEESPLPGTPNWFSQMRELYQAGRRKALGADVVLKDIMDELEVKLKS